MIGRWFFMSINVFFSDHPPIVYLIAGWEIISKNDPFMTFGTIVAFTTLQSRIFFPIGQLLSVQVDVQGALALFDRIFEYLDMPIDIQDASNAYALVPAESQGRITFKDVTFTYKRDIPEVLLSLVDTNGNSKGDKNGLVGAKRSSLLAGMSKSPMQQLELVEPVEEVYRVLR